MKDTFLLLLVSLLFISHQVFSQDAKIKLKDFRETTTKILGVSKDYIFTSNNNFELNDIDKVLFGERQEKFEHVYKTLSDAGIALSFGHDIVVSDDAFDAKLRTVATSESIAGKNINPAEISQKTIKRFQEESKYDEIIYRLEQFRNQRSIGMSLQFIGLGVSFLALPMMMPELVIIGGVASIVGLIVQADAGKHLNFKLKHLSKP